MTVRAADSDRVDTTDTAADIIHQEIPWA